MATSLDTLVQRTRRFLRDWPSYDTITASLTSSGTSLTVADSTIYSARWWVELGYEIMRVSAMPSATAVTVARGELGSTAVSHGSGTSILIRPDFYSVEIIDALNAGQAATFPAIYRPIIDTSTTTTDDTYEYTVPNIPSGSTPIPYISTIEIKDSGETDYRPLRRWDIRRGATPKIVFPSSTTAGGTLRINGYGPFADLTTSTSTIDTLYPSTAEDLPVLYAAQQLLASGEARRVRVDTAAIDDREQATRAGASISVSNAILQRFAARLNDAAMPPMPKHIKAVL